MRHLAILLVLLLGACSAPFVLPYVEPYQPPFVVDPVRPIEPIEPQPPSDTAIPYSLVEQVLPEMLIAEVTELLKVEPTERPSETENRQTWDYGECVDKDGAKRTLYVVTDDAGVVVNRILL